MKHRPRALFRALLLPSVLTLGACQDGSGPTNLLDVPVAKSVTVGFEAGDGSDFLFLPPLAKGKPSAAMATGLDLSVTICGSSGCETLAATEEDDHYHANWKSDKAQDGADYTVTVTGSGILSGIALGELQITLAKKGKDKAGSTFPIKFWVGESALVAEISDCVGDDRCNADAVPESVETTITTQDENGATMGQLIFPAASVPAGGLVVTLDCRQGGYAPGDGPLPTDLDQWPLFCHVDALNADGSPYLGPLPGTASIEICVVDELESGQAAYHGFADHHDLRLGKSHTGTDFEFLDEGPENLSCLGATTQTAAASPVGRFFDAVGSRLAWALSPVMPKKLYARRMFRDGGVGGLVSSFSDINPVQPAVIGGTVSASGGGGIPGVTVTLTGGPLTSPLVDTTDVAGDYSFFPVQAAPGGSAYTVTVSGLPAGQTIAAPGQGVVVTGTGTFVSDFETEPVFALNTAATYSSGYFGKTTPLGGGPFALSCGAGYVAVGLSGTTGAWDHGAEGIWALGLQCRELLADGTLGASATVGSQGSGNTGTSAAPFSGTCSSDQLLTGMNGRWDYVTNEIGGGCSTLSRVTSAAGGSDSTIGPWANIGGLGNAWAAACPAGYAITGLTGRSGWVVDGVGFTCTQITEASY